MNPRHVKPRTTWTPICPGKTCKTQQSCSCLTSLETEGQTQIISIITEVLVKYLSLNVHGRLATCLLIVIIVIVCMRVTFKPEKRHRFYLWHLLLKRRSKCVTANTTVELLQMNLLRKFSVYTLSQTFASFQITIRKNDSPLQHYRVKPHDCKREEGRGTKASTVRSHQCTKGSHYTQRQKKQKKTSSSRTCKTKFLQHTKNVSK